MRVFKGAGVAIITPMKENEEVNYTKLEELINKQIDAGTDAIIIVGTTGEGSTLSMEEHRYTIKKAVEFVHGRIPVVAGTGSNCTKTAIQLTKEAEEDGADAALIVTPYYNKSTQEGLYRHYAMIADETSLPIIMYNVPGRTGTNILPETVARLIRDKENIVGVKDATANMAQSSKMMYLTDGKMDLYSGEDGLVVPLLSIGAIGVISVVSNVLPTEVHDMCQAWFDGDSEKAATMQRRLIPMVDALFCEVNPIPVKNAMNMMGLEVGPLRAPLYDLSPEHSEYMKGVLKDYKLI